MTLVGVTEVNEVGNKPVVLTNQSRSDDFNARKPGDWEVGVYLTELVRRCGQNVIRVETLTSPLSQGLPPKIPADKIGIFLLGQNGAAVFDMGQELIVYPGGQLVFRVPVSAINAG